MTWIILGSVMCAVGVIIMGYALCKVAASADRHIEYMEYYQEEYD